MDDGLNYQLLPPRKRQIKQMIRAAPFTVLTGLLRGLVWLYRHSLSFLLGRQCRFLPTCSDYADQALIRYGAVKGAALAVKRFCRCHPWGGHGFDPVPPRTG